MSIFSPKLVLQSFAVLLKKRRSKTVGRMSRTTQNKFYHINFLFLIKHFCLCIVGCLYRYNYVFWMIYDVFFSGALRYCCWTALGCCSSSGPVPAPATTGRLLGTPVGGLLLWVLLSLVLLVVWSGLGRWCFSVSTVSAALCAVLGFWSGDSSGCHFAAGLGCCSECCSGCYFGCDWC